MLIVRGPDADREAVALCGKPVKPDRDRRFDAVFVLVEERGDDRPDDLIGDFGPIEICNLVIPRLSLLRGQANEQSGQVPEMIAAGLGLLDVQVLNILDVFFGKCPIYVCSSWDMFAKSQSHRSLRQGSELLQKNV
jgi:hypothetical protein